MNKKLLNAFLCGVAILSMSVFNSCKTDLTDLDTRLRALETAWADLKVELGDAVINGLYITAHGKAADGSSYDLTFSDGKTINIPLVDGGGTEVSVTIANGVATITIDGEPYEIPLGPAVSSLVYRPEFEDGEVLLGKTDVNVKFLATPAISAEAVAAATVKVADVYELSARTRAGDQVLMSVVGGKATLDGEYISVPLRALEVTAGKLYSVSIQMVVSGTTISSNYFPVRIADDYEAKPEELDETIVPIAKYSPVLNENKSYTITVPGVELLQALNVKDFYGTTAPAGATFKVAPAGKQPEGAARDKQAMLAASLAADGTWEFTERPGTDFGATGFQIEVLVNDEVKARTNITITDPFKDVNFSAPLTALSVHVETGELFEPGVHEYDIARNITEDTFAVRHNPASTFIENFQNYSVSAGDDMILFNNGQRIVVTEEGQKLLGPGSRGINWFNRQTSVLSNGGSEIENGFDGVSGEYMRDKIGVGITNDGFIKTTDLYMGWGIRVGMGVEFEYAYGLKPMDDNRVLCYIFFNRAVHVENLPDIPPTK